MFSPVHLPDFENSHVNEAASQSVFLEIDAYAHRRILFGYSKLARTLRFRMSAVNTTFTGKNNV